MMEDLKKAEKIIEAALKFSNDLGFFAEEGDVGNNEMLGNFPQTFVHASFIGAIIDLKKKKEEVKNTSKITKGE
jgi:GH15 family glucan-1,4-alpha-glucosidase